MDEGEIIAIANSVSRNRKGKKMRKFRTRGKMIRGVSVHAFHRYKERIGNVDALKSQYDVALKNGKRWFEIEPGPIQDYVRDITHGRKKLILLHGGIIYVFGAAKKGKPRNLVTMWPLPEPLIRFQKNGAES